MLLCTSMFFSATSIKRCWNFMKKEKKKQIICCCSINAQQGETASNAFTMETSFLFLSVKFCFLFKQRKVTCCSCLLSLFLIICEICH